MYQVLLAFFKKRKFSLGNSKIKVLLLFLILFWYASSGFLYFELDGKPDLSWQDALWWSLVTMTTVGYGDLFPVSPLGRYLVGIPTMIFGIGFLGFIISEVTASLIEFRSKRLQGMLQITSKNHILIINFHQVEKILKIIKELKSDRSTMNKDICLIDENLNEIPKLLDDLDIRFVRGNPTHEATLKQANIMEACHAIILSKDPANLNSDDQNLFTTLVIENLNPGIFSIVEVLDPEKIKQIELAGCDSAVCVSELTVNLIIQELQDPGVKHILHEITSNSFGQQLYFIPIKKMRSWIYKELVLWGLERNYTILGLMRDNQALLNLESSETIERTDQVILLGRDRLSEIETS
ncbi:MAG: hypothetical protein GY754_40090 [bacterium]|nr:hypothetical protein [bacterium]